MLELGFYSISFMATALAFGTEIPPNLDEPRVEIRNVFPRDGDLPKPIAKFIPPLEMVTPLLYFVTGVKSNKQVGLPQWTGLFWIAVAHCLMDWTQRHCGRFYTLDRSIKKGHKLVQSGPYRYCQHPGYVALSMTGLGVLVFTEGAYLNALPLLIIGAILAGIPVEEKMLKDKFGKEYVRFQATRKRFVPGIF